MPGNLKEFRAASAWKQVQMGVCTFLRPAPRLCITMPAEVVCGQHVGNLHLRMWEQVRKTSAKSPKDGDMIWATGNGALEPERFG